MTMIPPNFVFDARMRLENDLDCIVEGFRTDNTPVSPESLKDIAILSFNLAISAVISDCQHTLNSFSKEIDLSKIEEQWQKKPNLK